MDNPSVLATQAGEIMELMEDVVEHYCNENIVSGERVWSMVFALADYKLSSEQEDWLSCYINVWDTISNLD